MSWLFRIFCIFVLSSFLSRAMMPENTGNFYAPKISGVTPPWISYNGVQSPAEGLDNGKGNTVYFVTTVKNFSNMSQKIMAIKASHRVNRPDLLNKLNYQTKDELISFGISEMNLKNEAYFFILEYGHFESFKSYCQKERRLV
jgi:hypothetical protein